VGEAGGARGLEGRSADKVAAGGVIVEPFLEDSPAPVQAGHHGADRNLHRPGDLLVAHLLRQGHHHHRAIFGRQDRQRLLHLAGGDRIHHLLLRSARDGMGERRFQHGAGLGRLRKIAHRPGSLLLLESVQELVLQDPVQPGADVRARLEMVIEAIGAQVGVLDQILRVLLVAGEPHRQPEQRPQMRQRLGLELVPAIRRGRKGERGRA
jgi:hypothetical protein